MTRRIEMRPAITAFVVNYLPLPRNVFDKLVGAQSALAGMRRTVLKSTHPH
ncbi:hypothetical protein NKH99_30585 [Mesorhizobium sp. M0854]|uniref:hypothetical protein n=1 Tax=Mesorhizobium sp. M0854 TaxID=2957013 RepID=UPI00333A80FB